MKKKPRIASLTCLNLKNPPEPVLLLEFPVFVSLAELHPNCTAAS